MIDEPKAGRELDVKIGDEFFDMEFWYGDPTGFRIEKNTDYWIVGSEDSFGELNKRCPLFTIQMADAWLVVEKIRKDDPFGIGPRFAEEIAIMFDANQDDHYTDVYNVLMNLSAEAICLAALKATEK